MTGQRITRREFSERSILAMLGGVVVTVTACDDSGTGPTAASPSAAASSAAPAGPPGSVSGTISANHGHVAVITAAQFSEGDSVSIDITGSAGHPHMVDLTAEELSSIAGGSRLTKVSSTAEPESVLYPDIETHNHRVTFN